MPETQEFHSFLLHPAETIKPLEVGVFFAADAQGERKPHSLFVPLGL